MGYNKLYRSSIEQKEEFWKKQASTLHWFKEPSTILDQNEKGFYRWFVNGTINMSYLCIDKHVQEGRGEQTALIYDSPVSHTIEKYSYDELLDLTARFAGGLQANGITKGDTVVIYMPMIPQAVIAMLACARIGAIHSVVFGGFAPHELAMRIDDAKPKAVITASYRIEIDKIINYKQLVDRAIKEANHKNENIVLYKRTNDNNTLNPTNEYDFEDLLNNSKPASAVNVEATHPLYVLYTSGTTRTPKGIVRDTGGYATALNFSMKHFFAAKD